MNAQDDLVTAQMHHRADLEQLRALALRGVESELPVLRDALHAIDRDTPKVHITKEYLESVLESLTALAARLDSIEF